MEASPPRPWKGGTVHVKHVVSVSIGSSKRDHKVEVELLGEKILIERRGTDGDLDRAAEMIRGLDGRVDAIGLGGMDLYIFAGGRRYVLRDAKRIAGVARKTPVVDGSGLKNSLERWVVRYLVEREGFTLARRKVLMVAAVDRFGMAEELVANDADVTFGDLIFTLGVPLPLHSLKSLDRVARVVTPSRHSRPLRCSIPQVKSKRSPSPSTSATSGRPKSSLGISISSAGICPKRCTAKASSPTP